ncbi:hypothetical protein POVCU1_014470 [Plasmodium ovale curtisi]|uniref:Uncharacterized protein n=1 Tax=Plasmodium ovale curtisi TaxID=864141 RepID=A0A1A8W399_PLAOA|nr:hypothetical protein POVCU1_014470 [Plasmodium ovale curtisi]
MKREQKGSRTLTLNWGPHLLFNFGVKNGIRCLSTSDDYFLHVSSPHVNKGTIISKPLHIASTTKRGMGVFPFTWALSRHLPIQIYPLAAYVSSSRRNDHEDYPKIRVTHLARRFKRMAAKGESHHDHPDEKVKKKKKINEVENPHVKSGVELPRARYKISRRKECYKR